MTMRIAIILFVLVALAIAGDVLLAEGAYSVSLARRGLDLLQLLAFWR